MGEGNSYCLVAYILRKVNSNEDGFLPIYERLICGNSVLFRNHQNGIESLYLEVSSSPSLIQRTKQLLKEKFWTEQLSSLLPQNLEYVKYSILESFFGFLLSILSGQAIICAKSEQIETPPETCTKILQFASSLNQQSLAQDSPQRSNYTLPPTGEKS